MRVASDVCDTPSRVLRRAWRVTAEMPDRCFSRRPWSSSRRTWRDQQESLVGGALLELRSGADVRLLIFRQSAKLGTWRRGFGHTCLAMHMAPTLV